MRKASLLTNVSRCGDPKHPLRHRGGRLGLLGHLVVRYRRAPHRALGFTLRRHLRSGVHRRRVVPDHQVSCRPPMAIAKARGRGERGEGIDEPAR